MLRFKSRQKAEFGDFQTPLDLARQVCRRLATDGVRPACVLEPTCGEGAFLNAAAEIFPERPHLVGREQNPAYVATARHQLAHAGSVDIAQANFFLEDWPQLMDRLPQPLLVLGNPPWVTNSQLGTLESGNLPAKSNIQKAKGLDAKTGKANFDISQWMIERLLEAIAGREATLAMLCKTAVARKVLLSVWKQGLPGGDCSIREIDSRRHFGAAVDACLFTWRSSPGISQQCSVYSDLESEASAHLLGWHAGRLLADRSAFARQQHLLADKPTARWRSGIKHDCREIMQLQREGDRLVNRLGKTVDIETEFVFPLLPAGAIFRGEVERTEQYLLVPQTHTGQDTTLLQKTAPRTWAYLSQNAARLAARKSSIYRGRPPFSIFGVGPYSFSPWKVAISALHKRLAFCVVGPLDERPVMLDDTTYFLSFQDEDEARKAASRLNRPDVQEFYHAWIFWDAKRPITAEILQRLA